jgi:triphosphoribosyl-dephospho-CoA synthase
LTLAEQIELACLIEATARKPGNVHPRAAFHDLCYQDFVAAAKAVAAPLAMGSLFGIGRASYEAVRATRLATNTNVNLGIVLLLAPLAAVPAKVSLAAGLASILSQTTARDAEQVYAAISLAQPGGLGQVSSQDVQEIPTVTLQEAMRLAAGRDRIAEQYVTDFRLVFQAREKLCQLFSGSADWETAVITLHVWMLSQWPDTLIARKCGWELASEATFHANELMQHGHDEGKSGLDPQKLAEFDAWLRADGHRRNPGTTADLVAATLFAALRDGLITPPSREALRKAGRRP